MVDKKKTSSKEKELQLIQKIDKAKKDLARLQDKRKQEIGALAYKHGLDGYDSKTLDTAFAKLNKELCHGDA